MTAATTKILLVEDSKFMRLATERALARAGYDVSTAMDGETAIDFARCILPDLILLDLLLPKMGGLEVLRALKKDVKTARIPIVVLTGMSEKNAERLEKDGAYTFLSKEALSLDKGSEPLLQVVGNIVRDLGLKVPQLESATAVGK